MLGLQMYGLLDKLRSHSLVQEVFLAKDNQLTTEKFTELLEFNYSIKGSNRRKEEEVSAALFLDIVKEMEGKIRLFISVLIITYVSISITGQ